MTRIMSISQKKDFLPLLFKNKISRESKLSPTPFSPDNVYPPRGRDEKRTQCLPSVVKGLAALKEHSEALTHMPQQAL